MEKVDVSVEQSVQKEAMASNLMTTTLSRPSLLKPSAHAYWTYIIEPIASSVAGPYISLYRDLAGGPESSALSLNAISVVCVILYFAIAVSTCLGRPGEISPFAWPMTSFSVLISILGLALSRPFYERGLCPFLNLLTNGFSAKMLRRRSARGVFSVLILLGLPVGIYFLAGAGELSLFLTFFLFESVRVLYIRGFAQKIADALRHRAAEDGRPAGLSGYIRRHRNKVELASALVFICFGTYHLLRHAAHKLLTIQLSTEK